MYVIWVYFLINRLPIVVSRGWKNWHVASLKLVNIGVENACGFELYKVNVNTL